MKKIEQLIESVQVMERRTGTPVTEAKKLKAMGEERLGKYLEHLRSKLTKPVDPKPTPKTEPTVTDPIASLINEISTLLTKAVGYKIEGFAVLDKSAYRGIKLPDLEKFRDQIKDAVEAYEARVAEERATREREERARAIETARQAEEEEERVAKALREERARKAPLIDAIRPLETRLAALFVEGITIVGLNALEAMSEDGLRERLSMLKGKEEALLTTAAEPAAEKPKVRVIPGYKPMLEIEALGTGGRTGPTAAEIAEIAAMGRKKGEEKPAEQKKGKKKGGGDQRREAKRQGKAVAA